MAWVYMLCGASGRYYIGSTVDLDQRMEQHRRGHTHTTKRLVVFLRIPPSVRSALFPYTPLLQSRFRGWSWARGQIYRFLWIDGSGCRTPEFFGVGPGFESQPTHHFTC